MRVAISFCLAVRRPGSSSNHARAPRTDICETSPIWTAPTFTASASGFRRKPLQALQGTAETKREISSRAQSLSVSFSRRSRFRTTPSKVLVVS